MKKSILLFAFLITFFVSGAQNTMYHMEHMPQKQFFNPALFPEVDFYMALPGLNGLSFKAYNSGFNYSELDHFLDQLDLPDYDPDEFVRSIGENNRFEMETRSNIFGFGFKIKDRTFLSFNIVSNQSIALDAEAEAVYLLSDYDNINEIRYPIEVEGVDLNFNNYMTFGINYARKINDHLTIGINPRINYNLAGIKTNGLKYIVEIESVDQYGNFEYNETFTGDAVLGLPFEIDQDAIQNGELILNQGIIPDNWEDEMKVSDLFQNKSFSLNLGASYQLHKWDFSASLLNIGVSNWKRNAYHLNGNIDVIHITEEKIKVGIPAKLLLGAARQFSPRWNYGILVDNTFFPGKSATSATLSLNGTVGRMLSTSISYTAGHKFDNFGLGLRMRFLPGMDLFIVTDNLIQAINYKTSFQMSGSVGVNFTLGIKNHLNPIKEMDDEPEI